MPEKNYIFEDLKGKGKEFKENENRLFNELLEFEKSSEKLTVQAGFRIISFSPADERNTAQLKTPLKLAAESVESNIEAIDKRSHFFISDDNKFAIKYTKKNNEELCLSILSDSGLITNDAILYLPDLDKYFISKLKGDFVIGQYSNFDLKSLKLKAILPFDKIGIIKDEKTYSVFSYGNLSQPEIVKISEKLLHLRIKFTEEIKLSAVVLQTDKTKDFVKNKDDLIVIPPLLLSSKSALYLY